MALPDYFKVEKGTAVVFGEAGASGVTNTLTLDALAAGSARMSTEVDLGAQHEDEYELHGLIEAGTAPVAGASIDVWVIFSQDGTIYPGTASGSDGAWPSDGNEDEWKLQLGPPDLQIIATADGNVVQTQQPTIIRAKGRYAVVIVDNNWSQSIRDEATATNNDSRIFMIPRQALVQDAA